jgi:hypothetical protein
MRDCDGCTLCCKLMPIESVGKKAFEWCTHCNPKTGCTIYENRYEECKIFQCLWTWAEGTLGELIKELKPNKVKFIMTYNHSTETIEITPDDTYKNNWKKYLYTLKCIGDSIPVVVFNQSNTIGIGKLTLTKYGKHHE